MDKRSQIKLDILADIFAMFIRDGCYIDYDDTADGQDFVLRNKARNKAISYPPLCILEFFCVDYADVGYYYIRKTGNWSRAFKFGYYIGIIAGNPYDYNEILKKQKVIKAIEEKIGGKIKRYTNV